MNLYELMKTLPEPRQLYLKYKFNLYLDPNKTITEADFLRQVPQKTMNGYYRWEKSEEYKNIVTCILDYWATQDFIEIYKQVSEEAKKGDEKSIKLFMQLSKELKQQRKQAEKELLKKGGGENADEDDGLIL